MSAPVLIMNTNLDCLPALMAVMLACLDVGLIFTCERTPGYYAPAEAFDVRTDGELAVRVSSTGLAASISLTAATTRFVAALNLHLAVAQVKEGV